MSWFMLVHSEEAVGACTISKPVQQSLDQLNLLTKVKFWMLEEKFKCRNVQVSTVQSPHHCLNAASSPVPLAGYTLYSSLAEVWSYVCLLRGSCGILLWECKILQVRNCLSMYKLDMQLCTSFTLQIKHATVQLLNCSSEVCKWQWVCNCSSVQMKLTSEVSKWNMFDKNVWKYGMGNSANMKVYKVCK